MVPWHTLYVCGVMKAHVDVKNVMAFDADDATSCTATASLPIFILFRMQLKSSYCKHIFTHVRAHINTQFT